MTFTASLADIVDHNENGLLSAHSTWRRVPLAQVADILNGFPFPSDQFTKESGTPLLRIRDILSSETETYFRGNYDPQFLVEFGDLVVGMDGDFNCTIWTGRKALLNQRVCKVSTNEEFYRTKLLAFALPGYLQAINAETSSVTVKHLSSNTIAEIPLPLPPLGEQDRIVAEIEKQFTRLDAAVAALKRIQANLKRYRAAVLKAACEGRLVPTEAELARREGRSYEPASVLLERILAERRSRWAGTPTKYSSPKPPSSIAIPKLPEGWDRVTVEQVSSLVQYGSSAKTSGNPEGIPVLRMGNLTIDGRLELTELKYLPGDHDEFPDLLLEVGDLLFNRTNSAELVGKSAVYQGNPTPCSFASYLIRVKTISGCDSRYLALCLISHLGRAWIKSVVSQQVGQANVNGTKLQAFVFPLPPKAEQGRILSEVDRKLSAVEEQEFVIGQNLLRAERLRQSILKRAFEGTLVPQGPSDEPANILLDRIRADRNAVHKSAPTASRRLRKKEAAHVA